MTNFGMLQDSEVLEEIINIGIRLSREKNHFKLLEKILFEIRRITRADAGTLFILEDEKLVFKIMENDTLNIYKGKDGEHIDLPPVELSLKNVSSCAALEKKMINIEDVYLVEGEYDFSGPKKYDCITGYRTKSMLVIPLMDQESNVLGVIQLINSTDEAGNTRKFPKELEKIVSSLASQAAVFIKNMLYVEEINDLFRSFVEVMATAIDERSPYNMNHTRNIVNLIEKFAKYLNENHAEIVCFDENKMEQLIMASWLHDIGKIAIPEDVMDKPTRLGRKYNEIKMRLAYIEKTIELKNENTEDIKRLRVLVDEQNSPANFGKKEIIEEISKLARRKYINLEGIEDTWLKEDEIIDLSIVKGTLTDEERKVMESHVEVGRRMLSKMQFNDSFKNVPNWAMNHHEYMDGSGYPNKLSGEEIPIESRMLTIIDIFEALTSRDRPYKKAMESEQALDIMCFMEKEGKLDSTLFEIFKNSSIWNKRE